MNLHTFTVNPLGVNCYILWDDSLSGVVVDCGAFNASEFRPIATFVQQQGLTLTHHLLTHTHFDHIFGCDYIREAYGLKPEAHFLEQNVWQDNPELAYNFCGVPLPLPQTMPSFTLQHGQTITFGHTQLLVLHTPGHTPGGVCFYDGSSKTLLSGDTLFKQSMGRTDMPHGNYDQEVLSIRNTLLTLPASIKVYPGHGDPTTIGEERHNF